jgi:hypothetical protein
MDRDHKFYSMLQYTNCTVVVHGMYIFSTEATKSIALQQRLATAQITSPALRVDHEEVVFNLG